MGNVISPCCYFVQRIELSLILINISLNSKAGFFIFPNLHPLRAEFLTLTFYAVCALLTWTNQTKVSLTFLLQK